MHAIWCETGLRVKLIIIIKLILQNPMRDTPLDNMLINLERRRSCRDFCAMVENRQSSVRAHPSKREAGKIGEGVAAQ